MNEVRPSLLSLQVPNPGTVDWTALLTTFPCVWLLTSPLLVTHAANTHARQRHEVRFRLRFLLTFFVYISAFKFMQAYFSFDLSTNYARLDVTTVNNGGRLRDRL